MSLDEYNKWREGKSRHAQRMFALYFVEAALSRGGAAAKVTQAFLNIIAGEAKAFADKMDIEEAQHQAGGAR